MRHARKKGTAKGFLKVWANDSIQMKMTALMYDVLEIFKRLQQGLQRPALILPEVLSLRDSAVRKLDVIIATPMPGGMEEKLVVHDGEVKESFEVRLSSVKHQYVTTNTRPFAAIRQ